MTWMRWPGVVGGTDTRWVDRHVLDEPPTATSWYELKSGNVNPVSCAVALITKCDVRRPTAGRMFSRSPRAAPPEPGGVCSPAALWR